MASMALAVTAEKAPMTAPDFASPPPMALPYSLPAFAPGVLASTLESSLLTAADSPGNFGHDVERRGSYDGQGIILLSALPGSHSVASMASLADRAPRRSPPALRGIRRARCARGLGLHASLREGYGP